MQVDIVIVTFRSEAHIAACLAPLPAEATVIVVENASGDGAPELAETAGAQVIRNSVNEGFGAAANRGANSGSGEYLLFLNPDAIVARTDIELLVKALDTEPDLAAVGPRLVYPDGREQVAWWPFPSPTPRWMRVRELQARRHPDSGGDELGFVVGACMLVRRSAFVSLGGFDRRFWLYGEEADLCRRLWDAGWRVRLVPEAVATHISGASGSFVAGLTFEHHQRGSEHFIAKHHGSGALAVYRLRLLLTSLLRLAIHRDQKAAYRWAIVRRLTKKLSTHPFTVALPDE